MIEVNESIIDSSEKVHPVNADPYGKGWMIRIKLANPSQLDALLTAVEYEDYIKEEAAE